MTYSQPAMPPAVRPQLRGRTPLRLSFVFLVLAVAAIVIGAVLLARGYSSTIAGFQRVGFDQGSKTLTLDRGDYVGYVETPQVSSGNVRMRIAHTSGTIVPIEQYGRNAHSSSSLTYNYHGRHGQAVFKFRISTTGRYTVQLAASGIPRGSYMALGKSIAGAIVAGVLLVLLGVLLGIVFVVLLIVGLVKRSRSKRELVNPYGGYGGYGGPPPPPGYGQQPPPGYGQQPSS